MGNDFLKKQAAKMAISMIGTEAISEAIEQFMAQAIVWANQQPLLQDETKVVGLLYENEGIIFYAAVTLDTTGAIKRYLIDDPLKELVTKLLNNISDAG